MSESDEKHSKNLGFLAIIAAAISELGDSTFGYFLGIGLGTAASKWDGHLFDRKGCVELQAIEGITYKVDTCTGEVSPLEIETQPNEKE